MNNEKAKCLVKSLRNIQGQNLQRSDEELKKLDDIAQYMEETLLSLSEVVRSEGATGTAGISELRNKAKTCFIPFYLLYSLNLTPGPISIEPAGFNAI